MISFCDSRFVSNPEIIKRIVEKVDFQTSCFKCLWACSRGVKNNEGIEYVKLDSENVIYTIELFQNSVQKVSFAPEIYSDKEGEKYYDGFIVISAEFQGERPSLSSVLNIICNEQTIPTNFILNDEYQYFLNEQTKFNDTNSFRNSKRIENFAEYEKIKDELEDTVLLISKKDEKEEFTQLDDDFSFVKNPTYLLVNIIWDEDDSLIS